MAQFGAVKIWHESLNTMAKFGSKFPDCGENKAYTTATVTTTTPKQMALVLKYHGKFGTTLLCQISPFQISPDPNPPPPPRYVGGVHGRASCGGGRGGKVGVRFRQLNNVR